MAEPKEKKNAMEPVNLNVELVIMGGKNVASQNKNKLSLFRMETNSRNSIKCSLLVDSVLGDQYLIFA